MVVNGFIQARKSGNPNLAVFDRDFQQRTGFTETYNLLAAARFFGCSIATCEATFSVTRIRCHQRIANLILLAYETNCTKA